MEKKTLLSFFKLEELIAIFWVNNMIVVFDAILNNFFLRSNAIRQNKNLPKSVFDIPI